MLFKQKTPIFRHIEPGSPESRSRRRRLRACQECDWVVALPALRPGEVAVCPRCQYTLVKRHFRPVQRSMALALSASLALALSLYFPFVSFNALGIGQNIHLSQTTTQLLSFDQPLIAMLVALTVVILPTIYLFCVIWLQIGLLKGRPLHFSRHIARSLKHLHPWMMADVFILGALVSLFKISSGADIHLDTGFWAFCSFALLLLLTMHSLDDDWLWFAIASEPLAPEGTKTGQTASSQLLTTCVTCGILQRYPAMGSTFCERCGERLQLRLPQSLQRTWALLITASVLYIPANLYPIMYSTRLGQTQPKTIIGGVVDMINTGSWPIAVVIFTASIIVPVGKILALGWLCLRVGKNSETTHLSRVRMYRVIEFIGRWSMVDVFVVALLVALIRGGNLLSINPGPAALAFASVVILSMLAAISFDPRLIWDKPSQRSPSAFKDPVNE
ncbi:PqiA/YebS family transporter subunit [Methylophaga sp.]|uniref:PqiA/YebS family transporter subunit n=1 Tax=Methylophaga sp. TaxID=2024840 RepID=UPI003F69F3B8